MAKTCAFEHLEDVSLIRGLIVIGIMQGGANAPTFAATEKVSLKRSYRLDADRVSSGYSISIADVSVLRN